MNHRSSQYCFETPEQEILSFHFLTLRHNRIKALLEPGYLKGGRYSASLLLDLLYPVEWN